MSAHMPCDQGRACGVDEDALLIQRLRAFGLIERDGEGGWRLTACGKAGLASVHEARDAGPMIETRALRRWIPPTLAALKAAERIA